MEISRRTWKVVAQFISLIIIVSMVAPNCVVNVPVGCDFTINNIPFGVFRNENSAPRPCSAIGDFIINLDAAAHAGIFDNGPLKAKARDVFSQETLNAFMALGRPFWRETRAAIQSLVTAGTSPLETDSALRSKILIPREEVEMILPITIGDYTDFYSSREHATNVGTMFRGKDNALQPNW
jgi:fumarylacetoacetase